MTSIVFNLFDRIPNEIITLAFVIIAIFIIIFLIVVIIKTYEGTLTISLFKLKIESNRAVNEIQQQFNELNENSNLKTQILKLLNQANITIIKWYDMSPKEVYENSKNFYDLYLHGIVSIITKNDNMHRIAIFYKTENEKLKILHGYGFSPEGKKKLELSLHNSKAGYSFINNKPFRSNDITVDSTYVRNPLSSTKYNSLICVPIEFNDEVIGVLSIDGLNKNSFEEDDIDYITYFANAIAPILYKEIVYINSKNKEETKV